MIIERLLNTVVIIAFTGGVVFCSLVWLLVEVLI